MSRQSPSPQDPPITDDQRQVLAQLQRLYGRRSVAPDVFGRRPALPSEVERLVKNPQSPPDHAPDPAATVKENGRARSGDRPKQATIRSV